MIPLPLVAPIAARRVRITPYAIENGQTPFRVALPVDLSPIRHVWRDGDGFRLQDGRRLDTTWLGMEALAMHVLPRLVCRTYLKAGPLQIMARWENIDRPGASVAWAIGFRSASDEHWTRAAGGIGFRPAPQLVAECGPGSRAVGVHLISMALAALPGSGSGIAGEPESLADWSQEGIAALDLPAVHDAISDLEQ
jgi:hypothetical protein